MFTISLKSVMVAAMVTVAMVVGCYEAYEIFTNFSLQWYWFVFALFYSVVINEYFGHFCCGHKLFDVDTRRITYKILAFLNCVDHAWGPPSSMSLTHANHHMYADQGRKDSINPRVHYFTWFMSPTHYLYTIPTEWPDKENYFAAQDKLFHHIVHDPWTQFCEKNSHWLTVIYWAILYTVFPLFLFKVVFLGRVLVGVYTQFGGILAHGKNIGGYRNFDVNDLSYNKLILHYLCLCLVPSMLHNNHHGSAYNFTKGHQVRLFELDLSVYPMRLIKFLLEKRINK